MQALQIQIDSNLATVTQRIADRDLTDVQAKQLSAILAPLRGKRITILAAPNEPESEQFAEKIATSMTASGLLVSRAGGSSFGSQSIRGLGLATGASRSHDGTAIRKALAESKLAEGFIQTIHPSGPMELELFIGKKP